MRIELTRIGLFGECFFQVFVSVIYTYGEIVDFDKSDKMRKISGKGNKPNSDN